MNSSERDILIYTTLSSLLEKEVCLMEDFKLYTVEEIAEILKVTERTLYNYIKSGVLKAVKIGKYWRIKHTDLQIFIDKGTQG